MSLRADSASGAGAYPPGSQGPWIDTSGGAHHAVLFNFNGSPSSSWQGSGVPSDPYRLEFDGVDDRCTIPTGSIPELQGNDHYSLAMWFQAGTDINTHRYLVEWNETYSSPWAGMTVGYQGGVLQVWLGFGWGDVLALEPGGWYHVVVAKRQNLMEVFVNGTPSVGFVTPNIGDQVSEVTIGTGTFAGPGQYSRFHQGAIAQLAIFDGSLDAADAQAEYLADVQDYNAVLPGACCLPGPACLELTEAECNQILSSMWAEVLSECEADCVTCATFADCADLDGNGIRDDNCSWWTCSAGACLATAVPFADMGGRFGSCTPDGTADGNDVFHALNCFADVDANDPPPSHYPCEPLPPAALNVDAGGQFGSCLPDGVCDGNDAFLALNAFDGTTTCSCPANPLPEFDEPGGVNTVVGRTSVTLTPLHDRIKAGSTIEVTVHLAHRLDDLRGYQLHVNVSGGRRGALELVDIAIETRADHVFADSAFFHAFNTQTLQMIAGVFGAGVRTSRNGYLTTIVLRASEDAHGRFVIDLLHDEADSLHRTFLFPTVAHEKIEIVGTTPATVSVSTGARRAK